MARTQKRVTDPRIIVERIPTGLSRYANWVCWRAGQDGDPTNRIPVNPRTGGLATTHNVGTWSPLDEAVAALERDPTLGGLAYALFQDARTTAIHFEGCMYTDESRTPSVEATMEVFDTYCEVNPEGDGITMLVKSAKPGCRSRGYDPDTNCRVGIYDRSYFVPITGNRVDYSSHDIEDRSELLVDLYASVFSPVQRPSARWANWSTVPSGPNAPAHAVTSCGTVIVPEVLLDSGEDRVVREVIDALARDPELFQQDGNLVHVLAVPDRSRPRTLVRRATTDSLRAAVVRNTSLLRLEVSQNEPMPSNPPKWLLRSLLERGRWEGIRYLTEVSDGPMCDASGSVVCTAGYDSATGVLHWPIGELMRSSVSPPRRANSETQSPQSPDVNGRTEVRVAVGTRGTT